MILKVLSYNIHKGFCIRHKHFVLDIIKHAMRLVQADIVFLQEVVGEHNGLQRRVPNWPTVAQFEFLADEVWPHYAYGKNAVYDEGHHGNAILSRFPITSFENFDLSVGRGERRGVLHCLVTDPSTNFKIDCFCTHLGLCRRGRAIQIKQLCRRISETTLDNANGSNKRPLILAGDFNDWERRACCLLENKLHARDVGKALYGRALRTFPSIFPLFALDRIYTRGFSVKDVRALRGRPWSGLSDHSPLYAELESANV